MILIAIRVIVIIIVAGIVVYGAVSYIDEKNDKKIRDYMCNCGMRDNEIQKEDE